LAKSCGESCTILAGGFPSSNDTFSISQTTGTSPSAAAPGTSATEVPLSTATAVTGGGVPSPAVADLPAGVTQQTCQQFQSACVSSESTAAPFEFTVTLTCNMSSSSQVCSINKAKQQRIHFGVLYHVHEGNAAIAQLH